MQNSRITLLSLRARDSPQQRLCRCCCERWATHRRRPPCSASRFCRFSPNPCGISRNPLDKRTTRADLSLYLLSHWYVYVPLCKVRGELGAVGVGKGARRATSKINEQRQRQSRAEQSRAAHTSSHPPQALQRTSTVEYARTHTDKP
jgi:hypothetical protein